VQIAQNPPGNLQDHPPMSAHQRGKSHFISRADEPFEQVFVRQIRSQHNTQPVHNSLEAVIRHVDTSYLIEAWLRLKSPTVLKKNFARQRSGSGHLLSWLFASYASSDDHQTIA
jgi:hypothetical protein